MLLTACPGIRLDRCVLYLKGLLALVEFPSGRLGHVCFLYPFWLRGGLRKVNFLSHVYCILQVVKMYRSK